MFVQFQHLPPMSKEPDIKLILAEKGLSVTELADLLWCSLRQAKYFTSGEKALSPLELHGLENWPSKYEPDEGE